MQFGDNGGGNGIESIKFCSLPTYASRNNPASLRHFTLAVLGK